MTPSRFKPAVPKCWLFAASGAMWSAVGIMMCVLGTGWLTRVDIVRGIGYGSVGLVTALVAARWGFRAIAAKNIRRLRRLPDRGCFFAFQAWKSYLLIAVMIALGAGLRHSPVPKTLLAIVYIGIGGALLLSSFSYFRHIERLLRVAGRKHSEPRA